MADWTEREKELADLVRDGHAVVVNVRKSGPHKHLVPWLLEQDLITYIGHKGNRHSWPESPFANPFVKEAKTDRQAMLRHYREYLEGKPELLKRLRDGELDGRALGCWCDPQPCHGHVLLEYLK
ncbi:DUF4326 domain-containing protein [Amycolatopsis acidicola]|uniref:DUF4326 domain-containing protein n=1 Tax=Amycolatopsis acidicola TaxID=2596893 RepID=A0A5N0UPB8_9PSEU|nr:DUF4326 domain-containing protein [Amycolatopsis acidicola]KAA9152841.1 DUF4326 domain-containing protein [Amycolatopsis acidicola]